MNVLCAANKAHARHSKAARLQRLPGSGNERGMIG